MRTPKRVVLFCVLSLLSLLLEPLQAYGVSPLSGLKLSNSQNPPGAKVFAIKENSPALQSDLRINDVITSIEGYAVNSIDDFVRVSQGLKDKESVSISVNRWGVIFEIRLGKKSVVEQAKPETRVQAEPPQKEAEPRTVQKGFENPVVPNATGITYRHGQYPSEGNNTHPGIDITAECGSPIYAFADGKVAELIKDEKDPHFKSLGYMVIVKHSEPINSKDTYSLYLHMKEPPAVSNGQIVKVGDVIGKVGDTGNAKGCHVHFELRHFPDRFLNDKGWNYPLNIYGKGDQRNERRFLENWEAPEVYFTQYPGRYCISQEKKSQPTAPRVAEGERIKELASPSHAQWTATYGGTGMDDKASSVQQTKDGGFIVAGGTTSFGAGEGDLWVLKLNADGSIDPSSCILIQDTSISGADSNAIVWDTYATITYTIATPRDSTATARDTNVSPVY